MEVTPGSVEDSSPVVGPSNDSVPVDHEMATNEEEAHVEVDLTPTAEEAMDDSVLMTDSVVEDLLAEDGSKETETPVDEQSGETSDFVLPPVWDRAVERSQKLSPEARAKFQARMAAFVAQARYMTGLYDHLKRPTPSAGGNLDLGNLAVEIQRMETPETRPALRKVESFLTNKARENDDENNNRQNLPANNQPVRAAPAAQRDAAAHARRPAPRVRQEDRGVNRRQQIRDRLGRRPRAPVRGRQLERDLVLPVRGNLPQGEMVAINVRNAAPSSRTRRRRQSRMRQRLRARGVPEENLYYHYHWRHFARRRGEF